MMLYWILGFIAGGFFGSAATYVSVNRELKRMSDRLRSR